MTSWVLLLATICVPCWRLLNVTFTPFKETSPVTHRILPVPTSYGHLWLRTPENLQPRIPLICEDSTNSRSGWIWSNTLTHSPSTGTIRWSLRKSLDHYFVACPLCLSLVFHVMSWCIWFNNCKCKNLIFCFNSCLQILNIDSFLCFLQTWSTWTILYSTRNKTMPELGGSTTTTRRIYPLSGNAKIWLMLK